MPARVVENVAHDLLDKRHVHAGISLKQTALARKLQPLAAGGHDVGGMLKQLVGKLFGSYRSPNHVPVFKLG